MNPTVDLTYLAQPISTHFEQQVSLYGQRLAVKDQTQALTYDALNQKTNQLAHSLLSVSPEAQTPIILLFDEDVSAIVALLGVLKAGKIIVPLSPRFPKARLQAMVEHSEAEIIVTNQKNFSLAEEVANNAEIQDIINIDDLSVTLPVTNPELGISTDDVSAILYTSGSTGQPKGVMRRQRNALLHVWHYGQQNHISPEDNVALVLSYTFAAGHPEIFVSLLNGATLCIYDVKSRGLTDLVDWIDQEKITIFHPSVTLFRHFLDILPEGSQVPWVRAIVIGGQTVNLADTVRFKAHFSQDCLLINQLASTETNMVARFSMGHETILADDVVPVGYPVAGQTVFLLDDNKQPVVDGEIGELVLRSRFVSPGYWRSPGLTEAVFQPDPDDPDYTLYFSGDLARRLPDGCLIHLGRKDFLVKIRGYRVELAEVERALESLPMVKEAIVIAHEVQADEKQLVAYIVPTSPTEMSMSAVRTALQEIVPDYMLPSLFCFLETMPLTVSGKPNRQALPDPASIQANQDTPFVAPRDALETNLVTLCAEVLNRDQVSIHDNFFEIGGHSLLAAQLLARIDKTLGYRVSLTTLFQSPTMAQLAEALRTNETPSGRTSLIPIRTEGTKLPFFCLPGNLGNVYTDLIALVKHLDPDQPCYGLQDGPHNPSKIETVAAHYLAEIRTVQPNGPYALVGVCGGGTIAFEMAQQLIAQGESVRLLALIEPAPFPVSKVSAIIDFGRVVINHVRRRLWHHTDNFMQMERGAQQAFAGMKRKLIANMWANRRYFPKVYPDVVDLFLAEDTLAQPNHPRHRWQSMSAIKTRLHAIPGDHNAITGTDDAYIEEAYMQVVAEILNERQSAGLSSQILI